MLEESLATGKKSYTPVHTKFYADRILANLMYMKVCFNANTPAMVMRDPVFVRKDISKQNFLVTFVAASPKCRNTSVLKYFSYDSNTQLKK